MEYQTIAGLSVPIVYRIKNTEDIECPYCFQKHSHGTLDGHRSSHCGSGIKKHKVIVGDIEVDHTHGYSIKTLK